MDYTALAVIGSILASISGIYYFVTILRGITKPHRVTWFGWALVGILGAWSAFEGGAGAGAYVATVFAVEVVIVFLLSLLPGYGKPGGRKFDYIVAVFATLAIIIWQIGNFSPGIATTIAVIADLWFTWLTIRESWFQPETEALGPWIISSFAAALGVSALESFNYAAAAYPVYILVTCCIITSILLMMRSLDKSKTRHRHPPIL